MLTSIVRRCSLQRVRPGPSWWAAALVTLGLGFATTVWADPEPNPGDGLVAVPGGVVWYRVMGGGPGVPLLVLHGGPGGTSCGFERLEPLAGNRAVVRYDQLGSGRSSRPDDLSLWTVERFVEELHILRTQLGLQRMHLLGHSWGGALAAAYVLSKGGDGIVSLTLSSPLLSTPLWVRDANLLRRELPAEVQQTLARHEADGTTDSPEYEAASKLFYERYVYAGEKPPELPACAGAPWNPVVYEYMWGPTEFHATGTLMDFDLTPSLNEIDVPVLLLAGEFDEARPSTVAGFQQLIPDARFEVITGAAHATISKQAEAYMRILEEFLAAAEALKPQEP